MEKILPAYGMIFALMLLAAFLALHNGGLLSQKWSKVRVRTSENERRRFPEPREEDFGPGHRLEWLILGAMLLLICMLLSKV